MEEVIYYLSLKNQYYEKFYSITLKFLNEVRQENYNYIELHVDNRERILNILRSFDFKIAQALQANQAADKDQVHEGRIRELIDERKTWIEKIVKIDLELIGKMDEIKTETISELKKTVDTERKLESFSGVQRRKISSSTA